MFRLVRPCREIKILRGLAGDAQFFIAVHWIKTLSREALGFIAVCFCATRMINSIGLSGLHPTIRVPARSEPEGP